MSRWKASTCSCMIARARGAVAVEQRLEQVRLVVHGVAEPRHAVEHDVPDAQREREVALERVDQVRVAGRLPREAVDALVEAHQPVLVVARVELLDLGSSSACAAARSSPSMRRAASWAA